MKFLRLSLSSLAIPLCLIAGCGGNAGYGSGGPPPPSSNVLNGQYAFVLSGFDANANPMALAGSLTADGHGNITGGSVDVNDNVVISSSSGALAGTYTLDSNFRGSIALTNTVGSVTHPLAFALTLKADGSAGNLIGIDTNGFIISGTMQRQDATAFSFSNLAGDFAFEFDVNATSRSVVVGRFTLGQSGMGTNGLSDSSLAGTGPQATGLSLTFMFAAAGPNSNGRGTVTSTDGGGGTASFVYYVVSTGKILALRTDAVAMTGVVSRQSLPFTAATVNTAASVFALSGFDTVSPNDLSAVGVLSVTGSNTASLLWDADDVGLISPQIAVPGQAVSFDPNTGRGTIAVTGGHSHGLFDTAVFYLTSSGNGFLLDTTSGTNNRALAGRLQVQTGSGTFAQATFSGNKIVRQTGVSIPDALAAGAVEGLLSNSASNNLLTETVYIDSKFPGLNPTLNQTGTGTENIAIDSTTGRVTLTFSAQGVTNTNVVYMIGPNQYVGVDETPVPNNTIPIMIADPQ